MEWLRRAGRTKVYLGGDEHTDLVIDARRFLRARYDERGTP
jgi:hypothetical protein